MPLRQDREKGVRFSRPLLKIAASLPRAVYLLLAFLDLRWRWRMATPQGRVRSAMAVVWSVDRRVFPEDFDFQDSLLIKLNSKSTKLTAGPVIPMNFSKTQPQLIGVEVACVLERARSDTSIELQVNFWLVGCGLLN